MKMSSVQSRRDDTLLTVGFNLRKLNNVSALQSPAGTTLYTNVMTSSLPNFKNKTTSVENEVSHIINLITSFFVKRLVKLGNEVLILLTFTRATEVVLSMKLGKNEVFLQVFNYQLIKNNQ